MKSPKAVVNGQGKKMSRLGLLSLVTWMVVSLSAGTALAADFNLRKVDKDGNPAELVKQIDLQQEKDAKELLVGEKVDVKGFVERFSKEPTQFVEGIAKAVSSVKDLEKRKDVKKSLTKELEVLLASTFLPSDKDALLEVVAKLFKLDDANLDKLTRDELLKELLAGKTELLAKLGLTEKEKKVVAKKEKVAEEKNPNVGEPTDAELARQAAVICEHFKQKENTLKDQFAAASNALNEAFDRVKAMSKLQQVAQAPKKEQAEDVIPMLMKELMDKNKNQQQTQPTAPQVASAPAKDDETPAKNSVLDNPLPQPQQQQAQNQMPFMPQSTPVASSNVPQFSPDLPTNTGASSAIRRGQDAVALGDEALSAGVPSLTNQFTGRPLDPITAAGTLGASKTLTEGALTSVGQELKNSKNKLSQLTQVMDRLKNDAANAIPESLKQLKSDKEQALAKAQQALKAKQEQLAPMTQMAMMSGGQDPQAMMQTQMQVKMMSQQESAAVAQAQSDLEAITAQENLVKSKAKPELASYESQKNALEDTVSDLTAQKSKLDAQKNQIAQMLSANAQQALGANQGPANMYNRLGNSAPVAPTQRGRGLGGALNPTRGSLGGSVGSNI